MKRINDYIFEKFKISTKNIKNSKSLESEALFKDICAHFGIKEDDENLSKYISEWINKYKVEKVYYYADYDALEEARNAGMSEEMLDDFGGNSDSIIACQDESDNCTLVKSTDEMVIKYNENLLAYIYYDSGVYAATKEMK